MFFSKKLPKAVYILLTAVMLITALAGCGEHGGEPTDAPDPTIDTRPVSGPTPNEILLAAFDASMGEVKARFDASPLSRLSVLAGSGSRTVEFDTSLPEEKLAFSGTLIVDSAAGMGDLTLNIPDLELTALCHYNSEFLGVSCKNVFGDDRYYGLRPYGLAEQLQGSAIASMLELDMDAIARLDAALDAVPRGERPVSAPLYDTFVELVGGIIEKAVLTVKDGSFTTTLSSAELAGFLRSFSEKCPSLGELFNSLGGTGDFDSTISSVEAGGVDTVLTFEVSGDRVRHVSAEYKKPDGTIYLEAELYGETGDLLRVTLEPYFNLELTLNEDVHLALDVTGDPGSKTTLDWAADGTLSFITYSSDVTTLALDGTLTFEGDKARYDGIWFSGNRGDRNPITLTVIPGGEVKVPEDTVPLTSLTERDIFRIITHTVIGIL